MRLSDKICVVTGAGRGVGEAIARGFAGEGAQEGLAIRCNSVHPAAILTPVWKPMMGEEPERAARMAAFVADAPLRRLTRLHQFV